MADKQAKPNVTEQLPLRKCAGCGSTTFEVKRLAQVRGADYVNSYDEVRCVVCGRALVVGA